jgi:predicted N-formylglutamate amidohydrolase
LTIGDNEPDAIDDDLDCTIPVHAEVRGLPGVLIEIRQDGIQNPADGRTWAGQLAEAVQRTKMS